MMAVASLGCGRLVLLRTLALLVIGAAAPVASDAPCDVMVPPGRGSLRAASAALADRLAAAGPAAADVVVCLAPGMHDVSDAPWELGPEHSPPAPARVVWRGGPGVVVSGGAQVTGWAPSTLGGGPVYAARVPAAVAAAGTVVRQLWVRGARAARTVLASPATALGGMRMYAQRGDLSACIAGRPYSRTRSRMGRRYASGTTAGYACGEIPTAWLNNTRAIEFSWPIVLQNWVAPRCTIASIRFVRSSVCVCVRVCVCECECVCVCGGGGQGAGGIYPAPARSESAGGMTGPFVGVSVVSTSGVVPGGSIPGHISYAGSFPSVDGCAAACWAAATCTSYTWHDGAVTPLAYALQCFFRVDGDWEPSAGWPGHYSGDKVPAGAGNITLADPCGGFLLEKGWAVPVCVAVGVVSCACAWPHV